MCKRIQEEVTIDGQTFMADVEMIPLLKELAKVGLKARSHCYGHDTNAPHVAFWFDNIEDVQIRSMQNNKKDLVIKWLRP